ncbi:unnamed protein product [Tuber aestivum]|uniref:P-loop containing nucleoside triphosphate hydrolase protein n=1 Tax=Tuber aestivum TaxID=59557 RepID=A0A292Q7D1_9PEZI|nr:unnamed protein product [Tuber aestivum]
MGSTNKIGVCRFFASNGECRFGSGCKFSHNTDSSSTPAKAKLPCHFFQTHGRCRFGDECRYSHDPNLPKTLEDPSSAESLYRGWSQLLGRRNNYGPVQGPPPDLMSDQMEKFLLDALQILEIGTTGTIQQLIRDLGSERGLRRIAQIVETTFAPGYSIQRLSFKKHAIPFLKVMAHESMRNSLTLEREVGTIFNFLYGYNGQRGTGFFRQVADNLLGLSGTEDKEGFERAFSAATSTLFSTLNTNHGASVQEAFKPIVDTLSACATEDGSDGVFNYAFRVSQGELGRIKALLNMGDAIPRARGIVPLRFAKDPKLQYQMQVDFPGEFSREGPRHDNDHSDISKIRILPSTEEILSHRNEFLPQRSLDSPHHLEGISRVLDFQFRLLREDTCGQLREAARVVHDDWQELMETGGGKGKKDKGRKSGIQTLIYKNARIEEVEFSTKEGLVLTMTFDQPSRVKKLSDAARLEWWRRAKYVAIGSLLCLMDSSKRSTFLLVCQREVKKAKPEQVLSTGRDETVWDLASNPERCMVKFRFAESISQDDIANILNSVTGFGNTDTTRALVEFPGLLFASFDPVLKTLQQLSKSSNLPLQKWLAPSPNYYYPPDTKSEHTLVPPPLYMTKPGTELDLSCIAGGYPLKYSINRPFKVEELKARTTLDKGQCQAMIASLSQELSLIQGPPGTGKSHLGVQIVKVLLANRSRTGIGPIICVCYTNHALDQFLKHLLDEGVTNIVRIGSRTKLEEIESLSLQTVCQRSQEPTVIERREIGKTFNHLQVIGAEMGDVCVQLLSPNHPGSLKRYLEDHQPTTYEILFGDEQEDEDGFTTVRRDIRGGDRAVIENWIRHRDPVYPYYANTNRPINELLGIDIRKMSYEEKLKLKQYWLDDMRTVVSSELLQGVSEHAECRAHLSKQYQERERRCLSSSNVIGVTTTGFASRSELIRSLTAKVLMCEEAAEVLEAHILSALLPTLEHAILIGDHQQLRPQIMNHDLSVENPRGGTKYGLNTSLFERTAEHERYGGRKFPVSGLEIQRRMHPSISALIRNTQYPKLSDHPTMLKNPPVPGLAKRLFWMDHRHLEAGADKTELIQTSHANDFEVDMVVGLVRHLSRQGVYKSGDIAVLTPYLRQLFNLRKKLGSVFDVVVGDRDQEQLDLEESKDGDLELDPPTTGQKEVKKGDLLSEVRVATVDNFQGEEAKVVVISLVRSNDANKCGFLGTSNRINVLLSRAQHGMYIFGNAATCNQVKMWSDVIGILEQGGNIDDTLPLRCPRHPDTQIDIKTPEEFHVFSPEGGCMQRCEWRLDCGHPCVKKCHSDTLHRNTVCMDECERTFKHCGHPCPKLCGVSCGNCLVSVPGVVLPCRHESPTLMCFQLQNLAGVKCKREVERTLPLCGHVVSLKCHIDPDGHKCNEPCGAILPCGHQCTMKCKQCTRRIDLEDSSYTITNHGMCKVLCGRKFANCKHSCGVPCHGGDTCKPCSELCEVRCAHSRCGKKCSEACAPCAEECRWSCEHRGVRCEMPCAAPCDINPCFKRCDLQLACSHQCPSVCGEECPSEEYCQECGSDEILDRQADLIMFETYRNINLDEDPVIVPKCGHFYTLDTYDNHMGLKRVYRFDMFGKITGPRPLDGSDEPADGDSEKEELKIKNCPDCRAPLRDIHRYNRIIKSASLDEATRRFCISSHAESTEFFREVSDAEDLLEANRGDFIQGLKNRPANSPSPLTKLLDRANRSTGLAKRLQTYVSKVKVEEQPYGRVRQLVLNAERRKGTRGNFVIDRSMVQFGFRLKGQLLFFQLRWAALWDMHEVIAGLVVPKHLRKTYKENLLAQLKKMRMECGTLVADCQSAKMEKLECEARIYQAQFFALYRSTLMSERQVRPLEARMAGLGPDHAERPPPQEPIYEDLGPEILGEIRQSLDNCEYLCRKLPGTVGPLKDRVNQARQLLNGPVVFYAPVSTEEKRLVHLAMSAEFSSTGRWYTCPNGHPFTIGDCGMAREARPCPDCGATIGGRGYQLAGGVRIAEEYAQFDGQHGRGRI